MRSCTPIATALSLTLLFAGAAPAQQALAVKAGCTACHSAQKTSIGPAFHDVAVKYKGKADAAAMLTEHVRKGSKGVWGTVAMPPTPPERISDADLKALVSWVLTQ